MMHMHWEIYSHLEIMQKETVILTFDPSDRLTSQSTAENPVGNAGMRSALLSPGISRAGEKIFVLGKLVCTPFQNKMD